MAKIKLEQMSNPNFTRVMGALLKEKVPVKVAFRIKTLTNRFNDELKKFSEIRTQILENYCTKDEDGQPVLDEQRNYKFESEESIQGVTKELGDLLNIEVEVESIKISDLGDISLSGDDLLLLGDLINE